MEDSNTHEEMLGRFEGSRRAGLQRMRLIWTLVHADRIRWKDIPHTESNCGAPISGIVLTNYTIRTISFDRDDLPLEWWVVETSED
jgi:hypothetical protein